jgi:hypothetical protein
MHTLRLVDTMPATNRSLATYPAASDQVKQCRCRYVNSTKIIVTIEVHKVLTDLRTRASENAVWNLVISSRL